MPDFLPMSSLPQLDGTLGAEHVVDTSLEWLEANPQGVTDVAVSDIFEAYLGGGWPAGIYCGSCSGSGKMQQKVVAVVAMMDPRGGGCVTDGVGVFGVRAALRQLLPRLQSSVPSVSTACAWPVGAC
jgi:hypothetical protein